ncbi:tetratricopeptide repeat protein [candidate division KSB1 bacterium]|nr:tetratricopeptide repeat protein [candidate division KSB1 bacterium]
MKVLKAKLDLRSFSKELPKQSPNSQNRRESIHSILRERFQGAATEFHISLPDNHSAHLEWCTDKGVVHWSEKNRTALQFARNKDYDKAIAMWRQIIDQGCLDPDLYYNLAIIQTESKHIREALDTLNRTIELCPIHAKALFLLGNLYSKTRQFSQAEKALSKGLWFVPDNLNSLINLGAIFSIQKQFTDAIRTFERIISLHPKEARAYLGLGKVYQALGDTENAYRSYRAVIKIDDSGKLGKLAQALLDKLDYQDQEEGGSRVKADTANLQKTYQHAYQSFIKGDYKTAQSGYREYLHHNQHDASVWASLASVQLRLQMPKEACASIEKALQYDPAHPVYYKQAAIIFDAAQERSRAAKMAQKAIEMGKKDSVTLTLLGKNMENNDQEALTNLQEAIRLNPNNLNARFSYAKKLEELGEIEAAKQNYEEIMWNKSSSPLKEKAKRKLEIL